MGSPGDPPRGRGRGGGGGGREDAIETLVDMDPCGAAYRVDRTMNGALASALQGRSNRIPDSALFDAANALSRYEITLDDPQVTDLYGSVASEPAGEKVTPEKEGEEEEKEKEKEGKEGDHCSEANEEAKEQAKEQGGPSGGSSSSSSRNNPNHRKRRSLEDILFGGRPDSDKDDDDFNNFDSSGRSDHTTLMAYSVDSSTNGGNGGGNQDVSSNSNRQASSGRPFRRSLHDMLVQDEEDINPAFLLHDASHGTDLTTTGSGSGSSRRSADSFDLEGLLKELALDDGSDR